MCFHISAVVRNAFCLLSVLAIHLMADKAQAEVRFDLFLFMQPDYYAAYVTPSAAPNNPDFSYTTGRVASADNRFITNFDGQGASFPPPTVFTSAADLLESLDQTWTLKFDEGLATERNYTTTLRLEGLNVSDLLPPDILFPLNGSTISTLTPTFLFTHPTPIFYNLDLQIVPFNGSGTFVERTGVQPNATNWTAAAPLLPGTRYNFDLSAQPNSPIIAGLGFNVPLDDLGNPLPDWQSNISIKLEANTNFFTPVPEPSTFILAAIGGASVIMLRRRRS